MYIEEKWKTIEGYSDYEVSNKGEVRSFKFGGIRYLKLNISGRGYLRVGLYNNGEVKNFNVHQLVMATFVESCPEGKECNHKNGIKTDNQPENLEWISGSENIIHAFQNGLRVPSCPNEKPVQQFTLDGIFIAEYKSQCEAARHTGIIQASISK